MVSEKKLGVAFTVVGIVLLFLFTMWLLVAPALGAMKDIWSWGSVDIGALKFPVPPLYWVIVIPLWLALTIVFLLLIWIGTTLIRLPPPTAINIEEIEKELEKELKEEEEKLAKEEKKQQ